MLYLRTFVVLFLFFSTAVTHAESRNPDPFNLGLILPLSGPLADYGIATQNGIKLAIQHDPESYKNIRLIYEDSSYDPGKAVTAFNKLSHTSGVDAVFIWGTGTTQSVAPIAESKKIPLLAMATDQEATQGRKFVIRFAMYAGQYSEATLDYLRKKKFSNFEVIQTDVAFFEEVLVSMRKKLNQSETLKVIDSYQRHDNDFKTSIMKLKKSTADAVGVFLMPGQISQFFLQAQQLKFKRPFFGPNTFDSRYEMKQARGAMQGAVYFGLDVRNEFRKEYEKTFGNDVQLPFAALGHDLALVLGALFKDGIESSQPEQVIKRLRTAKHYIGATGKFSYAESGEAGSGYYFPVTMWQIGANTVNPIR